ncbi:GNAT family N-acetyltransferase [Roseibium aggregatum]|uniref:N-acetyltransferase n=1 Tax=Roseibium aggregatum TaxID=187304 RepID=A0A939ECB2_9HYPH|nr:N-acetyltransferase [Roseibium aggregatum]MBN9669967.1 N-acetyltransferase [Roseibium aggregatum]
MPVDMDLRPSVAEDLPSLEKLYAAAFPEEDLVPLLRHLLEETDGVLSLVAVSKNEPVGHVIFTKCAVEPGRTTVALLGPLCAAPAFQKQGVGSRLVRAGLEAVRAWEAAQVLVLGDPKYYGRFGFLPGSRITPPYDLPKEWAAAWQYLELASGTAQESGTLRVPSPWQDRALWSA